MKDQTFLDLFYQVPKHSDSGYRVYLYEEEKVPAGGVGDCTTRVINLKTCANYTQVKAYLPQLFNIGAKLIQNAPRTTRYSLCVAVNGDTYRGELEIEAPPKPSAFDDGNWRFLTVVKEDGISRVVEGAV